MFNTLRTWTILNFINNRNDGITLHKNTSDKVFIDTLFTTQRNKRNKQYAKYADRNEELIS